MWQATRDGILGSRQCLVLVAWPRILLFRVAQIGVKQNTIYGIFAPTSWSPMSKLFGFSESLGKSVGKKWSHIWRFLLIKGVKLPWQKKLFTDFLKKLFVSFKHLFAPTFRSPMSNLREILVEMVIHFTPGHWKSRISVCIILEHLKKNYFDVMAQLWDKTISQLQSAKIMVWELLLVFTLSRRNATNGNKFVRSLSPKL